MENNSDGNYSVDKMMMMMMMMISPQYVSDCQILAVTGCLTLLRIIVWVFWVL